MGGDSTLYLAYSRLCPRREVSVCMPKIFISYRRKSWGFTDRLVEELARRLDAEIFIDRASVDQDDFEHSIVGHLRSSQAVLLIVSEHTFEDRIHRDDDWVRREIREALTLNIPLVMVRIDGLLPPAGLPDDIRDVTRKQGIAFYAEYFMPAVENLTDFIVRMGVAQRKSAVEMKSAPQGEKETAGRAALFESLDLLEHGDFNKAASLLESLIDSGYKSRVDLEAVLAQVRDHAQAADLRQRAQDEYDEIAAMAARQFTETHARAAFAEWCAEYPMLIEELDTSNLRSQFLAPSALFVPATPNASADAVRAIIGDPFDWCEVPAGEFIYGEDNIENAAPRQTLTLPDFAIAKYPITYAQFERFIQANDGFHDARWWAGLAGEKPDQPAAQRWKIDHHPREHVNWYDAVAFCRWLSFQVGGGYDIDQVDQWAIRLPTEFEWEKAARGTQGLIYPYGNEFDKRKGNTYEAGIGKTTPVTLYPKGASPYDALDMCGNVSEWCLSAYDDPQLLASDEIMRSANNRVLRGDSWIFTLGRKSAAFRHSGATNVRSHVSGFRLYRPLSQ